MKLRGVTVYSEGYALLEFCKEIKTSSGDAVQLIISDVPGVRFGDRLSISSYDENDGFKILDCGWKRRSVPRSSWYESGSDEVKAGYEKLKESLLSLLRISMKLEFHKKTSESFDELIKNSVSPKVLSKMKETTATTTTTPSSHLNDQILERMKDLISKVDDLEIESTEKMIDLQIKMMKAREEAEAAFQNLKRLTKQLDEQSQNSFPSISPLNTNLKFNDSLVQLNQWYNRSRVADVDDIRLSYSAQKADELINLKIEYLVSHVSFRGEYNFRSYGNRLENCEVEYFATITQNTGIDWKGDDIPIYLTYGNPTKRQDPPEITKMFVDIKEKITTDHAPHVFGGVNARVAMCSMMSLDRSANSCVSVRERYGILKIKLPQSTIIAHGASEQRISISRFNLEAKLFHHVQPDAVKKCYRALLLTNTSDWIINNEESINVYVQGSLVGTSRLIKPVPKGNQFVLYAGDDDMIEIVDLGDTDYKSKAGNFLSGATKKTTNSTKLIFKNLHPDQVNLVISYKLPESKNQQVNVALINPADSKAKTVAAEYDVAAIAQNLGDVLNTKTGSYIHHRILKAAESWQSSFAYSITYPNDEAIRTWNESVN